ncbi:MAG: hypothetical protein KatS3mg087_0978 [Patescibacteria group bacterium]|nr:MAG: hypothetical protein KatS3mg087_0978 [Patescibacteria group bacterium]
MTAVSGNNEVLILTPFFSPNIGGVETHLDDLVQELKDQPFRSYVLTYQPLMLTQKAPRIEKIGQVEIHRIEWFRQLFYKVEPYPLLDFLYLAPRLLLAALWFMLTHRSVRTVHAQGINAACIGLVLKWLFRTRLVISTHAVYEFHKDQSQSLFAKVTRFVFNKSDKIFSLLQHSKQELTKLGVSENKIEPYTYWIDLQKFTPADKNQAKQKLKWAESRTHVLFIGRLIEKKGIKELLTAAALADSVYQFHIIGTGELDNYVQQHLNANSTYHGRIANSALPQYLQAADIFIIPSTHEEGAGRVIMEALACGTPVIGANRGGIPEILDTSVGELIAVSPENIVKALQEVRSKITNQQITSPLCRQYALEHFSSANAQPILQSYL